MIYCTYVGLPSGLGTNNHTEVTLCHSLAHHFKVNPSPLQGQILPNQIININRLREKQANKQIKTSYEAQTATGVGAFLT